jgi:predicted nucleotidyltransferase
MLSKNQVQILDLFRKNLFLKATMLEIMHKLRKKSYQRVYEAVQELSRKNMIQATKYGNSTLCELKLTPETISTLTFLEEQEALTKGIPHIKEIVELKEFSEDIMLVVGSYAKGTAKKRSDIDLLIITRGNAFSKQKLAENLTALFKPKVHPVVVSHSDYVGILLEKGENYGKEALKSRALFRNASQYFELIKEAIEHGFRG